LARSEWILALALCGGCDTVFSVGDPQKCEIASFDHVKSQTLVAAQDFSVDWDEKYAVLGGTDGTYEYHFNGAPTKIDLGPTIQTALALAPEADGVMWTSGGDPELLMAAGSHDGTTWTTGARVPRGTFAGTPSADSFGTRHVLVRLYDGQPSVQEYVDDSGVWHTAGDPHDVPGDLAPNLTPNGLTMVWSDADGVHEATRDRVDAWFGKDALVLAGAHRAPQLLGHCDSLYTVDNGMLTRYRQ
jgi:hypothetical protein